MSIKDTGYSSLLGGPMGRRRGILGGLLAACLAPAFPGGIVRSLAGDKVGVRPNRLKFGTVSCWAAQYIGVNAKDVAASALDLVVVEPMVDSAAGFFLAAADIEAMRRKPDGAPRLVLAYLSVGELDTVRFYWQPEWQAETPSWIGHGNPNWPGSLTVKYWDQEWQSVLFGHTGSMLDRILALGFDGVVLDRVDAYDDWKDVRASAQDDMAALVFALAKYARRASPDFLVVGLNAEPLLAHDHYRSAIDAVIKESLLYGLQAPGVANSESDVTWSLDLIAHAQRDGKSILAIEYLDDPDEIARAKIRHRAMRHVPFFTNRLLDRLPSDMMDQGTERAGTVTTSHHLR